MDSREFRDALGSFPTGVTVVTVNPKDGDPVGMTMNSFNSVSLDPPLVLFSVANNSEILDAFTNTDSFVINILSEDQEAISGRFATKDNHGWDDVAHKTWDTGCPVIPGAIAAFECSVEARHPGGDHTIYVGRVTRMHAEPDAKPLLFWRGKYSQVAPID